VAYNVTAWLGTLISVRKTGIFPAFQPRQRPATQVSGSSVCTRTVRGMQWCERIKPASHATGPSEVPAGSASDWHRAESQFRQQPTTRIESRHRPPALHTGEARSEGQSSGGMSQRPLASRSDVPVGASLNNDDAYKRGFAEAMKSIQKSTSQHKPGLLHRFSSGYYPLPSSAPSSHLAASFNVFSFPNEQECPFSVTIHNTGLSTIRRGSSGRASDASAVSEYSSDSFQQTYLRDASLPTADGEENCLLEACSSSRRIIQACTCHAVGDKRCCNFEDCDKKFSNVFIVRKFLQVLFRRSAPSSSQCTAVTFRPSVKCSQAIKTPVRTPVLCLYGAGLTLHVLLAQSYQCKKCLKYYCSAHKSKSHHGCAALLQANRLRSQAASGTSAIRSDEWAGFVPHTQPHFSATQRGHPAQPPTCLASAPFIQESLHTRIGRVQALLHHLPCAPCIHIGFDSLACPISSLFFPQVQ